jgi:hypothetical protein
MPLLTLFSAPKPFNDPHVAMIQQNAIRSWRLLEDADVLLLGEEDGLADTARRLGARHLPEVARNQNRTPLISSMFEVARQNSTSPLLCIINTDIVLLDDFVETARRVMELAKTFLMLSRRWDVDIAQPIDFSADWRRSLRELAHSRGRLHRPTGSDLFVFPRDAYIQVPPFVIGRAGWDNWMIFQARRLGWPVIDATPSVTAIHQEHDYGHLPGGRSHHRLPETDDNIQLAGGQAAVRYTVLDATHALVAGRLARPAPTSARAVRRLELLLRALFAHLPEDKVEAVVRPRRWMKRLRSLFR